MGEMVKVEVTIFRSKITVSAPFVFITYCLKTYRRVSIDQERFLFFKSPEYNVPHMTFDDRLCPSTLVVHLVSCAVIIFLNNIFVESNYWILTRLRRNDPWMAPIMFIRIVPV